MQCLKASAFKFVKRLNERISVVNDKESARERNCLKENTQEKGVTETERERASERQRDRERQCPHVKEDNN